MLSAFGAAGALGLLLGLRYRIPALLAASGVTAPVCLFVAPFTGLTPLSAAVITFTLLGVMQVGYLAGLMLSCAWLRAKLWAAIEMQGKRLADRIADRSNRVRE
jgi:hypothetical protein